LNLQAENNRCGWCLVDDLYRHYHDQEWGRPSFEDEHLFEHLILETFQAGLSWHIILKKRQHFRDAFHGFDAHAMAQMNEQDVEDLLQNPLIVRNRQKITAAIGNARVYLREFPLKGDFTRFMWGFVGGAPLVNHPKQLSDLPTRSPESDAMSTALKKMGFRFVGSTTCYAYMQALGMVNDHLEHCPYKHKE
jgi:DNA-3-methyladenine glycosylase I